MDDADRDVEERLHSGLGRVRDAVERNRRGAESLAAHAQRDQGSEAVEKDRIGARARAAEQEAEARQLSKRARRARKARRARPKAIALGLVAVVTLYVSLVQGDLWWLVFVAFATGVASAWQVLLIALAWMSGAELAGEEVEEQGSPERELDADPRVRRVRALCDELVKSIETGPELVRQVVQRPKPAIEGLRDAFIETVRRERELRAVLGETDDARLVASREELERRMAGETDAVTRDRLAAALRALDEQIADREALARSATRLDAESTRILYTLEDLRTDLLRARTSAEETSGSERRQLRDTLESLSIEIDAVAEALEGAPTPAPSAGRAEAARAAAARRTTEHS